jgi:hypothetical protein
LISTKYFTQQLGNTHSFLQLGTFSKIEHILGHKASLTKFKKIKATFCIISDHNRIKLKLNNERVLRKYSNTWKLKNMLLKNQWVIEIITEEFKTFLESKENEIQPTRICGSEKRPSKGKVYSSMCLH